LKELSISGHSLAFEEHSTGEHTLVFIHGWSSNQFFWKPILDKFYKYGRVVTFSLPGHYPSRFPENFKSFSQDELVELSAEAMRQIGGGKKLTLIGHSAGGLVSIGIAGKYPELVERLIAICPASHGPIEGALYPLKLGMQFGLSPIMSIVHKMLFYVPMSMKLFFANAVHEHSKFFPNPENKAYLEEYKKHFEKIDSNVMWIYLDLLDKSDIRTLARQVKCPSFFLLGDHDKMVPRTHGVRLSKLVSNSESFVMDCGHLPTLEEKEKSIELLQNWLELHPIVQ